MVFLSLPATKGASVGSKQTATQEGLLQLTSANWSEIQHGAWLVEFFSPYCSHCKKFLPTWLELVSNKDFLRTSYPDAPFTLAQVNCFAQQDVCISEKVPHVPRLSVYKDGVQMMGEYQGNREYTDLSTFIDKESSDYRKSKGVSDTPQTVAAKPAVDAKVDAAVPAPAAVEKSKALPEGKIDTPAPPAVEPILITPPKPDSQLADPPVPAVLPTPPKQEAPPALLGPNPKGVVLKYGKDEVVKDLNALQHMLSKAGGSSSTFVKFFASWCPHCKAMASAYVQVGEALRGRVNVVEVDCEAYKAICHQYGIQSFPTLRMYNEGEATEYRGGRTFEAMRGWAINAGSASGVREISANELDGLRNSDEVFFLYLHSTETPEREIDAVTKASRVLLTTPVHVYRSTDDQLLTKYRSRLAKGSVASSAASGALSGLLVFKDHDAERPTAAYYPSSLAPSLSKDSATADVASWFDKERYPTVSEVTSSTFSDIIHNKQDAPVVLAALSDIHHSGRTQSTGSGSQLRDEELKAMRSLAVAWRQRGGGVVGTPEEETKQRREKVIFAWIDADRWATAIRKYYNIKAEQIPRLVLADGARLEYFQLPSHFIDPFSSNRQPWIDNNQVFEALDLIWQGKGPKARSSRTYLDRGVRGTTGAIEAMAMSVGRHPLLSFSIAALAIFVILTSLRRQSRRMASNQRLPYSNGKAD
ncbi:hypothetical protein CBS101457_004693 [Exobasidium rhododendri]|nr:hypothetical protein CBS101457_004693 [Exobasidium rhododendri]